MNNYQTEKQILDERLEQATDFLDRMAIQDELYDLKVKYNIIEKQDIPQPIECIGCGS